MKFKIPVKKTPEEKAGKESLPVGLESGIKYFIEHEFIERGFSENTVVSYRFDLTSAANFSWFSGLKRVHATPSVVTASTFASNNLCKSET